jgi:nitroreductase
MPSSNVDQAKAEFLEAMRFRRAIKAFDPTKKVSAADFDFLLEVARLTPSSNGLEPWNILVVESQELRDKLQAATGLPAVQMCASHILVFTAKTAKGLIGDSSYYRHISVDVRGYPAETAEERFEGFKSFLDGKLGVLGNDRAVFDYCARQAYIAMGNVLTAAAFIGIESCPLEGLVYAGAEQVLSDAGLLDLETDRVAYMIALGYRAKDPTHGQSRRPMGEIVRVV